MCEAQIAKNNECRTAESAPDPHEWLERMIQARQASMVVPVHLGMQVPVERQLALLPVTPAAPTFPQDDDSSSEYGLCSNLGVADDEMSAPPQSQTPRLNSRERPFMECKEDPSSQEDAPATGSTLKMKPQQRVRKRSSTRDRRPLAQISETAASAHEEGFRVKIRCPPLPIVLPQRPAAVVLKESPSSAAEKDAPYMWTPAELPEPKPLPRVRWTCLLYTSPSPRDGLLSRMPSSA